MDRPLVRLRTRADRVAPLAEPRLLPDVDLLARADESDDDAAQWGEELPTGDEIADELEQYLRQLRGE